MIEREFCAGVPIAVTCPAQTVEFISAPAARAAGRAIHFCNAYTLSLAHADRHYRELLQRGSLCLPDGQSVVWVSRLLNRSSRLRKVSGPDLFEAAFAASDASGPRHYLLGGSPGTLEALLSALASRYPDARIVGHCSPPFRRMSEQELELQDEAIKVSSADIVWVGLGTPKQDEEVRRLADTLPVTAVAVGAAFDFSAGTKSRAPKWMRRSGLEWVHRLLTEPRRLWRRYLVGNLVFLWAAWRERHTAGA